MASLTRMASSEQVPATLVPVVETVGIGAQKPAHPGRQIALRRLDDQMKVVFHQTIGVNQEAGLSARLGQRLEKIVAIPLIQKDRLALVSPAHDVINRPRIFDAHLARHKRILPRPHPPRKPLKWTKLWFDPFDDSQYEIREDASRVRADASKFSDVPDAGREARPAAREGARAPWKQEMRPSSRG